ncbi:hypothetical protein VMCG_04551 [Cytospora schulzeri]|uniref:F-box domain-containing protein n=1 Tax=Cytospora schulzeri TaxID=448051 RepID=A0A423WRU9_9PEZI|nr:hypothetical protein VMCG_04551 [Valsa malicola]
MSNPANPPPPPRPAKRRKMSASSSASGSASDAVAAPEPSASNSVTSHSSSSQSNPAFSGFEEIDNVQPELAAVPTTHPRQPLSSTQYRAIWPDQIVPVEIFNLIIQHLDRADIKAMRLVNREFDSKLADRFFRHVVVPFRPEFEALYGTLNINMGVVIDQQKYGLVLKKKQEDTNTTEDEWNDSDQADPERREDDSLLSDGYRVFEQFGPSHIKKFALALELNEDDLACPPVKLNQQIIPAPWGLYRWPIMDYQRFSQLEGLEKMADETQHMKKAFQFLSKVSEIGISCDAGLGYLQGPDTNRLCRRVQPSVFQPTIYDVAEPDGGSGYEEDKDRSLSLVILKQMAMNAGYDTNEWPRVVLRLLEDEGRAVKWVERISSSGKVFHERVPLCKVTDEMTKEEIIRLIEALVSDDDPENTTNAAHARAFGLTPNNLTASQAEMLLELEWAHRALMESYVIAVMDNKDSFQSLRKLTIARCPGRHVPSLMKEKFWETMTCIDAFHLGVIPDWREVNKDETGAISQRRVSPVNSYDTVFQLLHKYVGEQENIKHVSFEWICGGEFAVGKSQRDRYILPAPVLADASEMVRVQRHFGEDNVLNLPFISTLSLKNCWISPHVFLNVFKHMSKENLEHIELESVSLTGPPSWTTVPSIHPGAHGKPLHWPWPLCAGAEPGNWFQLQRPIPANNNGPANQAGGHPFAAMPHNLPPPGGPHQPFNPWGAFPAWAPHHQFAFGHHGPGAVPLNHPMAPVQQNGQITADTPWRLFSWPHVLASLGMSPQAVENHLEDTDADGHHYRQVRLAEQRFAAKFRRILEDRGGKDSLKDIHFKSCGYALIDSTNIDNWKIIPAEPLPVRHDNDLPVRLKELDSQMLTCGDGLLGKVLNYIPDSEQRLLRNAFGVEFGWDGLYDDVVKQVAIVDGNPAPGEGRFHGVVSRTDEIERENQRSKGKQRDAEPAPEEFTEYDQHGDKGEDAQADNDGSDQDSSNGSVMALYDDFLYPIDLGGGKIWDEAALQDQPAGQASSSFVLVLHGGPPSASTPGDGHNLGNDQQDAFGHTEGTQNNEQAGADQGGVDNSVTLAVAASDSGRASENLTNQSNQDTQIVIGVTGNVSGQDGDAQPNVPTSSRQSAADADQPTGLP